ncbi:MAG TPA: DUF494 domain-containing protein [Steroidobacteraceae bacterium]|nr:DUF494 domain-containing protein [Steroidobacteraceae bacterium]HRX88557.1 DUF494 domain-containing protein [Steroidobacteraceae bacterium]
MNGSVVDILIYVFDQYMLTDHEEVPERDTLAEDLERAGFGRADVERALDWLADLAGERHRAAVASDLTDDEAIPSIRIYVPAELERISTECRGYLLGLEEQGILSPSQREIVIDRLMALDMDDVDIERLKWLVLMVLSSQPGQEQAYALMENLVFDDEDRAPH